MGNAFNSYTDIPGEKSATRADVDGDSPMQCPKCGKPLSAEYGTFYCFGCRVIIDPKLLETEGSA